MTGLALYRLPYEQQVTMVAQTEGEPQELPSKLFPIVSTAETVCFLGRNSLFQ